MKSDPRLFYYKLTTDNGGAPCTGRNMLSLGICKPKIRASAERGDWIFGFGSKNLGERLIYVAQVGQNIPWREYAVHYRKRADCVYRWTGKKFVWKQRSRFHNPAINGDQTKKDTGPRADASVLISRRFLYFGKKSPPIPKEFRLLQRKIAELTQGHRLNHSERLRRELILFRKKLETKYGKRKVIANPTESDQNKRCNQDQGSASC